MVVSAKLICKDQGVKTPKNSKPRWFSETDPGHSQWYAEHFRELSESGGDTTGEARLIDAIVAPASRILDAGCGQGRTAGELNNRGHHVVGVDIDPVLIEAARLDNPGPTYICADLSTLELRDRGQVELFDAAVSAGNVITYVAPGAEVATLAAIRSHLLLGAPCVIGFHTERYDISEFDAHLSQAGFVLESRFSTWDLRPWSSVADFCVSILRNPDSDTEIASMKEI
jgi:SAM-dependent methyltransferase